MTSGEKTGLREGGWGTTEVAVLISIDVSSDSSTFSALELSNEDKTKDCGWITLFCSAFSHSDFC